MNPSTLGTYDPANGLRMTVREAARRKGVAAMAPPSWKISSTHVIFLRTTSSGMHQAPFTNERRTQFRDGTNHTRFSLQFQSGTPDQANFLQAFGGLRTNQQRLINLCCAQLSDGLSDQAIPDIAVGSELKGDAPAIIHVGARKPGRGTHRGKNFFGDGTRHRRHGCDEKLGGVGQDSSHHAAGDDSARPIAFGKALLSQEYKFAAELVEDGFEARAGRAVGILYFAQ